MELALGYVFRPGWPPTATNGEEGWQGEQCCGWCSAVGMRGERILPHTCIMASQDKARRVVTCRLDAVEGGARGPALHVSSHTRKEKGGGGPARAAPRALPRRLGSLFLVLRLPHDRVTGGQLVVCKDVCTLLVRPSPRRTSRWTSAPPSAPCGPGPSHPRTEQPRAD